LLPKTDVETYTQALMDLGATVCTRTVPRCDACPVSSGCKARKADRTAQIPAPRPRKTLPQRAVTWLLLLDRGQILMEKRPAPGIWGGLWSFPESPAKDPDGYCRRMLGCEVRGKTELETLEHGFTHFRLRIRPLLCEVKRKPDLETPGRLWIDLADAAEAAVPTPVRKLLSRVGG
jgi:A/G-specific adenine glycosylase